MQAAHPEALEQFPLKLSPSQVYQLQLMRNVLALEIVETKLGPRPEDQYAFMQKVAQLEGKIEVIADIIRDGTQHYGSEHSDK